MTGVPFSSSSSTRSLTFSSSRSRRASAIGCMWVSPAFTTLSIARARHMPWLQVCPRVPDEVLVSRDTSANLLLLDFPGSKLLGKIEGLHVDWSRRVLGEWFHCFVVAAEFQDGVYHCVVILRSSGVRDIAPATDEESTTLS